MKNEKIFLNRLFNKAHIPEAVYNEMVLSEKDDDE